MADGPQKLGRLGRRTLRRRWRWLAVHSHRLVDNERRIYFCDAHEEVPVVYAAQPLAEQTNTQKTIFTNQRGQGHHRKIQLQQFPEDVASAVTWKKYFTRGPIFLVGHYHGAAHKPTFGIGIQHRCLGVERARQTPVIIIQKSYVLAGTFQNANIARAGDALITFETNVPDARESLTDGGSLVGGSIVNHDDLDIRARLACAFNRPSQQMRATMGRDYDAGFDHAFESQLDASASRKIRLCRSRTDYPADQGESRPPSFLD